MRPNADTYLHKECEKAGKALEKAGKSRIKAEKGVHKAEMKHNHSVSDVEKAERLVAVRNEMSSNSSH